MGEFRRYLFTGNAWQKYARRNGIGAGNPANWLVNSTRTRQTGFCGFDYAITGAIYFTFHNGKKSSLDRLNNTSIQVFHFKISVKKKRKKEIRFDKQKFFRNFNQQLMTRLLLQSNSWLARCEKTSLTGPLEYKYRVILVLVLGVICTLRSAVG